MMASRTTTDFHKLTHLPTHPLTKVLLGTPTVSIKKFRFHIILTGKQGAEVFEEDMPRVHLSVL